MNIGPFDLDVVIARLAERVPDLRAVGGAADFAAAYERPDPLPGAFVIPSDEDVLATPLSGGVQLVKVTSYFDVAVAVRQYRAADRGAAHLDTLLPILRQIRAVLYNWVPAIPAQIVNPIHGDGRARILRFDADVLWWADRYSVVFQDRVPTNN